MEERTFVLLHREVIRKKKRRLNAAGEMGWGEDKKWQREASRGAVLLQGSEGGERVTPGLSLPQEGV